MYTGLDGFGPFDKGEARIYAWRYEYFKAQGKNPTEEISREDWEAMKVLLNQVVKLALLILSSNSPKTACHN